MVDLSASGQAYNRFDNLDAIDGRIISYLLSYRGKTKREKDQVDVLRKLIYYQDPDALEMDVPTNEQMGELISNGAVNQDKKRVFRSPYLSDSLDVRGSLLKVYIDSIIPENPMTAIVNVSIEAISNVEDIDIIVPTPDGEEVSDKAGYLGNGNVYIDEEDTGEVDAEGNKIINIIRVDTESRVSAMTKAILYLLNGAAVQGVGKLTFSRQMSIHQQAQYGLWSRRKYEGMKIVMGVRMSGVS